MMQVTVLHGPTVHFHCTDTQELFEYFALFPQLWVDFGSIMFPPGGELSIYMGTYFSVRMGSLYATFNTEVKVCFPGSILSASY